MRHLRQRAVPVVAMVAMPALFGVPAARGHDVWILPSSFTPPTGDLVRVELRIGHGDGEEVARNPRFLRRLVAIDQEGAQTPAVGLDGSRPAGIWRPERPGPQVLVYESHATYHELSAERFAGYLAEEGLEAIAEERHERGEDTRPGRELYSRSLKSLVTIGIDGDDGAPADWQLDLPLELVLETKPAPNPFRLRLLRSGEPLADALVDVRRLDADGPALELRTNQDGRVAVPYRAGTWMAAAVVMTRSGATRSGETHEADWESVWTSLTFRLP